MDIERQLEQLTVDLDVAAREARSRIGNTGHAPFSDEGQPLPRLRDLLTEMARVIDRTLRAGAPAGMGRRLNVWTGYDSILVDGRVTAEIGADAQQHLSSLHYPLNHSNEEKGRAIQTGMIFPPSERRIDRSALYFDAALGSVTTRSDDDNTFSVGGTHNWLALGPNVACGPLVGFEVRTTEAPGTGHESFPVIALDPSRPLEWGASIAREIDRFCGNTEERFWPLPVRRLEETRQAYASRLAAEYGDDEHNKIRHRLYSLWLIGCFLEDPMSVLGDGRGKRWLDQLVRELEDIEPERAQRIRSLVEIERKAVGASSSSLDSARFTRWGVLTIPYPIADSRATEGEHESDELGSAMLLSDQDIPPWYYFAIRQWIASYYLSLRQQENSVLRAEREAHRAALDAERQLRRQLSHAIGTELTYVNFLAAAATAAISTDNFNLVERRVAAAARCDPAEWDSRQFIADYGALRPVERQLVDVILGTSREDWLSHDVSLIARALTAVPSEAARNHIAALFAEVERITIENRALVRVDDPSVVAKFELALAHETRTEESPRLTDLLAHALVVALTVYLRKAFPADGGGSEKVCGESAEALFLGDDVTEVRTRGATSASAWRQFIAESHRLTGKMPAYADTRQWLLTKLEEQTRLRFDLPLIHDCVSLARGCGEYAPLVVQAWLTEALLNALKHTRPSPISQQAKISVRWQADNVSLEVSNTTTPERVTEAADLVNAALRGERLAKDGHQGVEFLSYAAKHLFPEQALHAFADAANDTLVLQVRKSR